jgi:hypothetical protein
MINLNKFCLLVFSLAISFFLFESFGNLTIIWPNVEGEAQARRFAVDCEHNRNFEEAKAWSERAFILKQNNINSIIKISRIIVVLLLATTFKISSRFSNLFNINIRKFFSLFANYLLLSLVISPVIFILCFIYKYIVDFYYLE